MYVVLEWQHSVARYQFQETKKIAQENKATENQAGVMELIKESKGLLRHDDNTQW